MSIPLHKRSIEWADAQLAADIAKAHALHAKRVAAISLAPKKSTREDRRRRDEAIIRMREGGATYPAIAKAFGLNDQYVRRIYESETYARRYRATNPAA